MLEAGISTCVFSQHFDPAAHLPLVAKTGFSAIELSVYRAGRFDWRNPKAVRQLKTVCADLGINVWSIHSPDDNLIGSADERERQQHIDMLRETLDLADELGARRIASHGLLFGDFYTDRDGTVQRMIQSIMQLMPRVYQSGARLAFENDTVGADRPWRAANVLELVRHLNAPQYIGFLLDTGHANIAGDLPELCQTLGRELISLHLNDNYAERDVHLPPGEGSVDWHAVWSMLRRVGYNDCVMYEISDYGGSRAPVELLAATRQHHQRMLEHRNQ